MISSIRLDFPSVDGEGGEKAIVGVKRAQSRGEEGKPKKGDGGTSGMLDY